MEGGQFLNRNNSNNAPSEFIEPHAGPQTDFLASNADIAIYGGQAGGGKSWALLVSAASFHDIPDYGAVIFRRESPQITNEGGLWDESMKLYPRLGAIPRRHTLDWTFVSGANIGFRHLQYESDMLSWMGSQVPMIGFDELTHFTEQQFWYLLSRNRSTCGVRPFVRATTNPAPADDPVGGWVRTLIDWWIDPETGYAIPERSGVIRWFARVDGELKWAENSQTLKDQYGSGVLPKSLTFIPAKLSDNPTLLRLDPAYQANLMALPEIDKQRLAEGNWNAERVGSEWPPEYFDGILTDYWPHAFDAYVAYLDPSKGKTDRSDYSAIVGLGLSGGILWADADIARRPVPKMVRDSVQFCQDNPVMTFGVEANSFQDLLAPEIDRVAREAGWMLTPIELVNNTINKVVRINRLSPYLARKQLRIRNNDGGKLLVRQLKDFPDGKYDDGPDALDGAIQVLKQMFYNRRIQRDGDDEYETVVA